MLATRRNESSQPTATMRRRSDHHLRGRHERLSSSDVDHHNEHERLTISDSGTGGTTAAPILNPVNDRDNDINVEPIPDETTELNTNNNVSASTTSVNTARGNSSITDTNLNATGTDTRTNTDTNTGTTSEDQQLETEDENTPFDTEIHSQLTSLTDQCKVYKNNTQTWSIISSLLLFRLWMESLLESDIGLFFISLICTSYFFRWKQWRAIQEHRLEERIENLLQLSIVIDDGNDDDNADEDDDNSTDDHDRNGDETGRDERRRRRRQHQRQRQQERSRRLRVEFARQDRQDHADFEMMSFQAQLAFALMESQRIMQNGNHGRDGDDPNNPMRGVSEDKKQQWRSFEYTTEKDFYQQIQSSIFGKSVTGSKDENDNEEPTCCICLCEYEKGDKLVQLQCGHAYHSACIDSWCSNHVRCPLCNLDLDQNNDGGDSHHHHMDSIV